MVEACINEPARVERVRERGVTRVHSLTEAFSTLTGGRLGFRSRPEDAAILCR